MAKFIFVQRLTRTDIINYSTIATIGFFDGVHLGHCFLLNELKTLAQNKAQQSLVVTFENHPQHYFSGSNTFKLLTSSEEKLTQFEYLGLDACLALTFNEAIASMRSSDFLSFLHQNFGVTTLLVGYDHRFGSDIYSSFNDYKLMGEKIGVELVQCSSILSDNLAISSSKIRDFLSEGFLDAANQFLGYHYRLSGLVSQGNQVGRKIGFPTANLLISNEKMIPKDGVYAVRLAYQEKTYLGMLNIGNRPTIQGDNRTIEVHIFDFNENIYGKELSLELVARVRDEVRYDSLEALKIQLHKDKIAVLELLKRYQ